MRRTLAGFGLLLYRITAYSGVLKRRWAQRLFLWAYMRYKDLIEAHDAERLASWVPSGGVVFDVGANVGFFTLKFARWVGPSGRVLAFEPAPHNVQHLNHALAAANLNARVIVIAAAAAERVGNAHLELNPFHPGDHKLGEVGLPIEATTLDQQVSMRGIERVDLVKIDVQGAERLVIAGAKETLRRWHPALYVEIDEQNLAAFQTSAEQLIGELLALGYDAHTLTAHGLSAPLTLASACAWLAPRAYADLLFLPHRAHGNVA